MLSHNSSTVILYTAIQIGSQIHGSHTNSQKLRPIATKPFQRCSTTILDRQFQRKTNQKNFYRNFFRAPRSNSVRSELQFTLSFYDKTIIRVNLGRLSTGKAEKKQPIVYHAVEEQRKEPHCACRVPARAISSNFQPFASSLDNTIETLHNRNIFRSRTIR